MNAQAFITLERETGDIEVIVEAKAVGGGWVGKENERRYEAPDVEDLGAWQMDGTSIELSQSERELAEEAILEAVRK